MLIFPNLFPKAIGIDRGFRNPIAPAIPIDMPHTKPIEIPICDSIGYRPLCAFYTQGDSGQLLAENIYITLRGNDANEAQSVGRPVESPIVFKISCYSLWEQRVKFKVLL